MNKSDRQHLLGLIAQGEGMNVEFKSSFQKESLESLVAFANAKGGQILVGVNGSGEIIGVELGKETLQNWINQCKLNTTPSVIPDIEPFEIDGKWVVIIGVDEYPIKPVAYKGRYFKRAQNSNHQMSPIEISDAHIKLINSSWDYHPDPLHDLLDLSHEKVLSFAQSLQIDTSFENILEKFELVKVLVNFCFQKTICC